MHCKYKYTYYQNTHTLQNSLFKFSPTVQYVLVLFSHHQESSQYDMQNVRLLCSKWWNTNFITFVMCSNDPWWWLNKTDTCRITSDISNCHFELQWIMRNKSFNPVICKKTTTATLRMTKVVGGYPTSRSICYV